MPDPDHLIDREGHVHDQGWDGQYRPRPGFFGTPKETDWLGNADAEQDIFGGPKKAEGWTGQKRSSSGVPLYIPRMRGGGRGEDWTATLALWIVQMIVWVAIVAFLIVLWMIRNLLVSISDDLANRQLSGRTVIWGVACAGVALMIGSFAIRNTGTGTPYPYYADTSSTSTQQQTATRSPSGQGTDGPSSTMPAQQADALSMPELASGRWLVVHTLDHWDGDPYYRPKKDRKSYRTRIATCTDEDICRLGVRSTNLATGRSAFVWFRWNGDVFRHSGAAVSGRECLARDGSVVRYAYRVHELGTLRPDAREDGVVVRLVGEKTVSGTATRAGMDAGCEDYTLYFTSVGTYEDE
jgi:hypothetical protein